MLLDLKNCTGKLGWHENSLNVEFDLSVEKDGSINLSVKDIPFEKEFLWLRELYHKKKRYFEFLQLKGQDVKGNSITSGSVVLNTLGERLTQKGAWLCPAGTCMQFGNSTNTLTYDKATGLSLQYRLLGFKCFDPLSGTTDVGSVKIGGSTKVENCDEVTGVLTINNPSEQHVELTDWLEHCDKTVRSILDILSLANDRYIDWTSRSIFFNELWVSSLFIGPRRSGKPSQPPFTHLDLQPILNLAIANYSEELKQKTGLDVAIEWFLMKSTYAELQFLTIITALEHLIFVYMGIKKREKLFQNKAFEKMIRPQVEAALDRSLYLLMETENDPSAREAYPDQIKAARNKITEMNRYTFKENLRKFLEEYKVPLDGIDADIEPAIDVRNKIVHRGIYLGGENNQSIDDHLAVLRELLIRIFLTLLKYNGEYQSYLNGPEWKKFYPN